jgi:anti-sigma factor RsiW
MNCRAFRKYVGAFADGELDTQANAAALEHLNMCPPCTGRVTEVQQLKVVLGGIFAAESAPPGLAVRIRNAIRAEAAAEPKKPTVLHRLFVPLTMAAALAAAVGIWHFWRAEEPPSGNLIQARFAADTREQHRRCTQAGPDYHDATLGRSLQDIAANLTQRLKLAAIAPDLEAYGFRLVGADACGVGNRPGGHVLYQDAQGCYLSVFSLAASDCGGRHFGAPPSCRKRGSMELQDEGLSVVAWSEGVAAYVLCSKLDIDELNRIRSGICAASRS